VRAASPTTNWEASNLLKSANWTSPETNATYLDGQRTPISPEEFSSTISGSSTGESPILTQTLPDTGTGGEVNTTSVFNDICNTNNPRSVYSENGSSIILSGQGAGTSDEGGLYTAPVGTNTTTGGSAPTPIFNVVSIRTVSVVKVGTSTGTVATNGGNTCSANQV
jgi:hypothetical protein